MNFSGRFIFFIKNKIIMVILSFKTNMSCYIERSALTEGMMKKIVEDLVILPENKSFSAPAYVAQKDPIRFYTVAQNESGQTGIYLPYAYSVGLFQKHLNHQKSYPQHHFEFKGELYPNQTTVFEEVITDVKKKGSGILIVPPGWGKTVIGSKIMSHLQLPGVVVVHLEILVGQWLKTFNDTLTCPKIWVVGQDPEPAEMPDIIICMVGRTKNIPPRIKNKIGVLLIDEAHCFYTEIRGKALLEFTPKYVIAETATLEKSSELHKMIHLMCGSKTVHRSIDKKFKVIRLNTNLEHPTQTNKQGKLDWNFLLNEVCMSEPRNQIIVDIVKKNPDHKILILSARTEHVKKLKEMLLADPGVGSVDTFFGNKKGYKDSRVLIGTISKIGTGFDEKSACEDFSGKRINLVILATSIKDEGLLEQNIGRGFRCEFPLIYDLVDKNATLRNHYYIRHRWYLSKDGDVENE